MQYDTYILVQAAFQDIPENPTDLSLRFVRLAYDQIFQDHHLKLQSLE